MLVDVDVLVGVLVGVDVLVGVLVGVEVTVGVAVGVGVGPPGGVGGGAQVFVGVGSSNACTCTGASGLAIAKTANNPSTKNNKKILFIFSLLISDFVSGKEFTSR